jgi:hypothetical protein
MESGATASARRHGAHGVAGQLWDGADEALGGGGAPAGGGARVGRWRKGRVRHARPRPQAI